LRSRVNLGGIDIADQLNGGFWAGHWSRTPSKSGVPS
jgi:hypothetical protein